MLYGFLSGNIRAILQYKFDKMQMIIDGKKYEIQIPALARLFLDRNVGEMTKHLSLNERRQLKKLFYDYDMEYPHTYEAYHAFSAQLHIPFEYFGPEVKSKQIKEEFESLHHTLTGVRKSIDSQILYLPTYRRIEQELKNILAGKDELSRDIENRNQDKIVNLKQKQMKASIELVEFGMQDVAALVDRFLGGLKDYNNLSLTKMSMGYLGVVLDQEYSRITLEEIQAASEESIRSVLDKVNEPILSKKQKEQLIKKVRNVREGGEFNERAKLICHYILRLLKFRDNLSIKESPITSFCGVCNRYMSKNKTFSYDNTAFDLSILQREKTGKESKIEFKDLSSGEKQIVSLFSHLYLSGREQYFVIIDEPELSLSVPWQRKFLVDIRKGGFCTGLIAATHSPFIFDNELQKCAHGIGEYIL
jgi:hypothetical protein